MYQVALLTFDIEDPSLGKNETPSFQSKIDELRSPRTASWSGTRTSSSGPPGPGILTTKPWFGLILFTF